MTKLPLFLILVFISELSFGGVCLISEPGSELRKVGIPDWQNTLDKCMDISKQHYDKLVLYSVKDDPRRTVYLHNGSVIAVTDDKCSVSVTKKLEGCLR